MNNRLTDRNALARLFLEFAGRAVPPHDAGAVRVARDVEVAILRGIFEGDGLGVLKWFRRLRTSSHYRHFVADFLRLVGAIPLQLPDEDTYRRRQARDKIEKASWQWLSKSDQALIHEYLTLCLDRGNSEYSVLSYLSNLGWLEAVMGRANVRHLADIRSEHIGELVKVWRVEGFVSQTCTRMLSNLKTLFTWLYEEKGIGIQPVSRRHIPRSHARQPRPLRPEELVRLRKTLDEQFSTGLVRPLFYLILATGLRISEAIAVRVSDIDRDSKGLYIPKGKGGEAGKLPIAGFALERIDEWLSLNPRPSGCQHIFHRKGFQITQGCAQQLRVAVGGACGIRFGWHQLRSTFATRLAEAKVGPFEIQRLMRHKYLDTIMKYIKCGDTAVRSAYIAFVDELLSPRARSGPIRLGTASALLRRRGDQIYGVNQPPNRGAM